MKPSIYSVVEIKPSGEIGSSARFTSAEWAATLEATLRALLPYAESRAEDMLEIADEEEEMLSVTFDGKPMPGGDAARAAQARAASEKARQAVDAAKRLLVQP